MTKFISPISVTLPRKTKKDRKILLNLNIYRNLHYLVNNQVKHAYKELMLKQLEGYIFTKPITITFTLFKSSNRRIDRSNILSVVEKFFCDAMTELGCILDDNDDFILETHYRTGGVDKNNPRVEIEVN